MSKLDGLYFAVAAIWIMALAVEHYAAKAKLKLKSVALKTRTLFEETDG